MLLHSLRVADDHDTTVLLVLAGFPGSALPRLRVEPWGQQVVFVQYTPNIKIDITGTSVLLKISFTLRVDDPAGTVYTYPLRQASAMGFHVGAMNFFKNSAHGDANKGLLSMKQRLKIYEDGHSREARTRRRTVRLAIIVPEDNGTWTSCIVSQLDWSTMNEKVEAVRIK